MKCLGKILSIIIALLLFSSSLSGCKKTKEISSAEKEAVYQEYIKVNDEFSAIEKDYLDSEGYVPSENIDSLLQKVLTSAEKKSKAGEIEYYEKGEDCVYIEFSYGVGYIFSPTTKDTSASGTEGTIITLEPYYSTDDRFLNTESKSIVDNLANEIKSSCKNYSFDACGNLNDSEVSIESLKSFKKNSIVLWLGHGGYTEKCHSFLATGIQTNLSTYIEYWSDIHNHRLMFLGQDRLCVTAAFFDYYYNAGDLDGSLFYLANCWSGKDDVLANTLIKNKGAETVIANTEEIYIMYNSRMMGSIIMNMSKRDSNGMYINVDKAIALAKDVYGNLDNLDFVPEFKGKNYPTHNAEVKRYGDGDYTFLDKTNDDEKNTTSETQVNINTYGNTVGNINNGGDYAQQGDWIYFSDNGLNKIKTDGTGETKICNDLPSNINVVGDWIYYTNYNDDRHIYKIRTNGKDRKKLNNDISGSINVVDEWIYYQNYDDNGYIYKIREDGTMRTQLNHESTCKLNVGGGNSYINVVGDWVYYANANSNMYLYKIKTDGTCKTQLNSVETDNINVVGNWIYYTNYSNNRHLYKIKTDGTEMIQLNSDFSYSINVVGDWIYYLNDNDKGFLYKIRTDGTERTQIDNKATHSHGGDTGGNNCIYVVGDWIYYWIYSEENFIEYNNLCKIRTDGTENQKVK